MVGEYTHPTKLIWLGRNSLGQSNNPAMPGLAEPDVDLAMG